MRFFGKLTCLGAALAALAVSVIDARSDDFSDWSCKSKLTFTGYTNLEDQANFPALVMIGTNIPDFDYSTVASPGGADLRLVDAGGVPLSYEIERWDTNGLSFVWVQIPTLSTGTYIWAYWGNDEKKSDQPCNTNSIMWKDCGYALVMHMAETVGSNVYDVVNGKKGTVWGTFSWQPAGGRIDGALRMYGDTTNDRIVFPAAQKVKLGTEWALSSWFMNMRTGNTTRVLASGDGGEKQVYVGGPQSRLSTWSPTKNYLSGTNLVVPAEEWHHLTAVGIGTKTLFYLDGMHIGTNSDYRATNDVRYINNSTNVSEGYKFAEYLDEFRISNAGRGTNWVWAEWMNQASNTSFITYGTMIAGRPLVNNAGGATNVQTDSAFLNGTLIATGGSPTHVYVFWGPSDGGSTMTNWSHTNYLGVNSAPVPVPYTTNVTSLLSETTYYYRFYVTNDTGSSWAKPSAEFKTVTDFAGFPYKMKVTFSGYKKPETLTNFPAVVTFSTNTTGFDYSTFASPSGADLRFSDSNAVNTLDFQVEQWLTTGQSYAWVRLPELAGSNDFVWAYWGSEHATNPPPCTTNGAVWSAGFAGVWHLGGSFGTKKDATTNRNHGTTSAYNGDEDVPGIIGNADDLDGDSGNNGDYIGIPDADSLDLTGKMTMSAWIRPEVWSNDNVIIRKESVYRFQNRYSAAAGSNLTLKLQAPVNAEVNYPIASLPVGQWYHVAGTYNSGVTGSNLLLYVNGVRVAVTNATGVQTNTFEMVYLGRKKLLSEPADTQFFNGIIDEARIESVPRSSNWIWACWMNQGSNSLFNASGSVTNLRPVVNNAGGATEIQMGSARLNGTLLSTANAPTEVYVFWDMSDRGQTAAGWAHTNYFGTNTGPCPSQFTTNISDLTANAAYFYRFYATNSIGTDWSDFASSFNTLAPAIQFTVTSSNGQESVSPAALEVGLSAPLLVNASVDYSVTGGTASNGMDYSLAAGTATIPAGNTATNITIVITNDTTDEFDETIVVHLANPVNSSLGANIEHTYTILDDDLPPTVSFAGIPYSVFENASNMIVTVSLGAKSGKNASVNYATADDTAHAGSEYTNTSGILTWTAGESGSKTFSVPIIDNGVQAGSTAFSVMLSNSTNCSVVVPGTTTVTIIDDEKGPPTVNNSSGAGPVYSNSAVLNGVLLATGGAPTTVWIYWGGSNGDTNKGAWATNAYLGTRSIGSFSTNIYGLNTNSPYFYRCFASNSYEEAWAAGTAALLTGPPRVQFTTAASSNSEPVSPVQIELGLYSPSMYGMNVSVSYSVTGGTASNGTDYVLAAGTATITAGTTMTNISVTVSNDAIDEYNETMIVGISNAVYGVLGTNTAHTFTILDDDPLSEIFFTNTPYSVSENGTSMVVRIGISLASEKNVTVAYATANGTAVAGSEYTNTSGTLAWPKGDGAVETFAVPIIDNVALGGNKWFNVELASPGDCLITGNSSTNVTIVENDFNAPVVTNDGGPSNVLWTVATLNGYLAEVFPVATAYICWGPTDGVTNTVTWSNVVDMGSTPGFFSTAISGLRAGSTNYYRCYATNSVGKDWADETAVFTTLPPVAVAANYYVNDTDTADDLYCSAIGDSANSGTNSSSPKDTVQAILSTYNLEPGDVIWIDTGLYSLSSSINVTGDDYGTAGNCVVLRGVTSPQGSVFDRGDTLTNAVTISGQGYVRIESLKLTGGKHGVVAIGRSTNYCPGVEISGCEVYGNGGSGAGIWLRYTRNSTVVGNVIRNNDSAGVFLDNCSNVTVTANDCGSNTTFGVRMAATYRPVIVLNALHDQTPNGYGLYSLSGSRQETINSNLCYLNGYQGIYFAGSTVAGSSAVLWGNRCWSNETDGIRLSGASVLAGGNVAFANGGRGIYASGQGGGRVCNNLLFDNGNYNLELFDSTDKILIENNTLVGGKGMLVKDPSAVTNRNNIVWASGEGNAAIKVSTTPTGSKVFVSDYNDFHAVDSANVGEWGATACATLDDWQTTASRDNNSISTDPLFVDSAAGDYHEKSRAGSYHSGTWQADPVNSPCIDTGDPASPYDNEPTPKGTAVNMGAYGNTLEASKTEAPAVYWTITASAGAHGQIAPSGDVNVLEGSDTNFVMTPDPSYAVSNVFVDSVPQGATNSWKFTNVTNGHTILVEFKPGLTSRGTPYWWLIQYNYSGDHETNDVTDTDKDGALAWEEYQAGTDPTNKASVFAVLNLRAAIGSNWLSWYATTNSGVYTDLLVYRATNLPYATWDLRGSNLTRRSDGTNEWWDTNLPPAVVPVFYKPALVVTNQ